MDNALPFPRDICFIDTRPQEAGRGADIEQGIVDLIAQPVLIVRAGIGEALFAARPDKFVRIELGGVGGKPVDLNACAFAQIIPDENPLVDRSTIPEQVDFARHSSQKTLQELENLHSGDVFGKELEAEPELFSNRRNCDGRNRRHLVALVTMAMNRRLPSRRPGPSNVGDEQEAAFVEEDQMGAATLGVFLYVANPRISTAGWPSRPAARRVVPAFDNSSPCPPKASTHVRDGSKHRAASGFALQFEAKSKVRWRSRQPSPLSAGFSSAPPSALPSSVRAAQARAWASTLRARNHGRPASISPRSLWMHSASWQPRGIHVRRLEVLRPLAVGSRAVGGCHRVSCPTP